MDKSYFCPQDLLIEILSWLPVISLLRFRCVCKSWLSLFANPDFVNKHISQDHDDSHRRLLVRRHHFDSFDSFSSLSYRTLDVIPEDLGLPFNQRTDKHQILGSYDGIVCLAGHVYSKDVMFWNPATRKISLVPKSGICAPPGIGCCYSSDDHGFGYDFKTKDYKVFKIINVFSSSNEHKHRQQTEVYSSRTDSWKKIDNNVIPDGFRVDYSVDFRVCINEIYPRLVYSYYDGVAPVFFFLKFDMSDEESILTPMPGALDFGDNRIEYALTVTSLNNAVALLTCHYRPSESNRCFEIFILNEYGPSGTWTKLYSVGPLSNNVSCPLIFRKKNELIFRNFKGELVLCDYTTHESNILKIRGMCSQICEYKESLVSFNIKGEDHTLQENSKKRKRGP